ncbi:hypothetical protein ACJIZ3_023775 [Penstemon smallii]|uniref:Uncharacterized protein n=1 Tax=Penstemon smallii TaxID=265156 RepID=A0ABD3TPZ7_9LAMI
MSSRGGGRRSIATPTTDPYMPSLDQLPSPSLSPRAQSSIPADDRTSSRVSCTPSTPEGLSIGPSSPDTRVYIEFRGDEYEILIFFNNL